MIAALLVSSLVLAVAPPRDSKAVRAFKHANPCPYTKAEGCIVDHVVPLCAGGPDHPSNMQWQTVAAAKRKDQHERHLCAISKRPPKPPQVDLEP